MVFHSKKKYEKKKKSVIAVESWQLLTANTLFAELNILHSELKQGKVPKQSAFFSKFDEERQVFYPT